MIKIKSNTIINRNNNNNKIILIKIKIKIIMGVQMMDIMIIKGKIMVIKIRSNYRTITQ